MGEVINLKLPDRAVWQCACGSYQFWLYSDGEIRCCLCHHSADPFDGRYVSVALSASNNVVNLHARQLTFDFIWPAARYIGDPPPDLEDAP